MDRSPSPSRRRFLAGTAAGAAVALAGCTSAYGALPNRVTYARTKRRGVPSVPTAVETTGDHLRDLAAEIDVYADGLEVWDRIDGPERGVVYSDRRLEDALEFADTLLRSLSSWLTRRSSSATSRDAPAALFQNNPPRAVPKIAPKNAPSARPARQPADRARR